MYFAIHCLHEVKTKIQHVDGFTVKVRGGGEFVESLPQLRAGVEFRAGLGGARDTNRVYYNEKAYSEIALLMLGGGPFLAWKQPLGDDLYIEAGGFFSGYTVGIHEKGRKYNGYYYNVEQEGGVGWSTGFYGKLGILDFWGPPSAFSLEFSYEVGKWDFGSDLGKFWVKNFTFLIASEIKF